MASTTSANGHIFYSAKSVEDAERFVQDLYLPGSPKKIGNIQQTLHQMQRSPEGWQLADALLNSNDEKVRFFGALTFTIKINQDCAQVVPSDSLTSYPSTSDIFPTLNQIQAITTLWFSSMLVEEVAKADNSTTQTNELYEKLGRNLDDAVIMIRHALRDNSQQDTRLQQEGIKCFQSWVDYAQRAWINHATALDPLTRLTQLVMPCIDFEETFEIATDCITDLLTNYSAFFTSEDLRLLRSMLCDQNLQQKLMKLKSGDYDTDHLAVGRLLLALGDATVQDLARNYEASDIRKIMQMLHGLLTCDGYAVAEDEICAPALEFWNMFTEYVVDSLYDSGTTKALWINAAIQHVLQAIEECWVKLRFPAQDEADKWDSEVRTGFKAFRADVKDLLQASFILLGLEIIEKFANLALSSLEAGAWFDLESTLFSLNALSECTADEDSLDRILARLFGSPIFKVLSDNDLSIPPKTKQTAVYMLGHYTAFFKRQTTFLPQALDFLFASLQSPALAGAASKSISVLCSSCRKTLVSELGTFLRQYESFLSWPNTDISTKERVIGAIAAIVQAIPSDEEKLQPMDRLLVFIEADVQSSITLARAGDSENTQSTALSALRCLSSVGKALQAPDDLPIDLEHEEPLTSTWFHGFGESLQSRIVDCIKAITDVFHNDGEIIEAACDVLRTGYKETTPGPFVFAPEVTVHFVTRCTLITPRLDYVLNTACVFLTSHNSDTSATMTDAANALLIHALNLIRLLNVNPAQDPEVASSTIDLLSKLLQNHMALLLNPNIQNPVTDLFTFTLRCLTSSEILPKRSAASFWTTLLSLPSSPAQTTIIDHTGPALATALIHGISGNAQRSELDALAEPLRKFVFKQLAARKWLEDAICGENFPEGAGLRVSVKERREWVGRVVGLRGARATNAVVKEFWIKCRGAGFAYTS